MRQSGHVLGNLKRCFYHFISIINGFQFAGAAPWLSLKPALAPACSSRVGPKLLLLPGMKLLAVNNRRVALKSERLFAYPRTGGIHSRLCFLFYT
jgi:hypothetical protein